MSYGHGDGSGMFQYISHTNISFSHVKSENSSNNSLRYTSMPMSLVAVSKMMSPILKFIFCFVVNADHEPVAMIQAFNYE